MIYSAIVNLRNWFYEKGVFKTRSLGLPTISVGNLTVGGTGKTPLVACIAGFFIEQGEKPCILTRGYGRDEPKTSVVVSDGEKIIADARVSGDEPRELAEKLFGKAVIVANADRLKAAKLARENYDVTVFVLDDGFQHRRVRRDLDLICVDATNPFGNGRVLPFGKLRESVKNLDRADAVVLTRANLIDDVETGKIKEKIAELTNAPVFISRNQTRNRHELRGKYLAFCALGNPKNFFRQLESENIELIGTKTFADHHFYKQNDIRAIEKAAQKSGADALLTTAKDRVKLANLKIEMPCFTAETELIFDEEEKLREILSAILQ